MWGGGRQESEGEDEEVGREENEEKLGGARAREEREREELVKDLMFARQQVWHTVKRQAVMLQSNWRMHVARQRAAGTASRDYTYVCCTTIYVSSYYYVSGVLIASSFMCCATQRCVSAVLLRASAGLLLPQRRLCRWARPSANSARAGVDWEVCRRMLTYADVS